MKVRPWQTVLFGAVLMQALAACSLFSFRTPDKPLPQRDLNTRMLTREFATTFQVEVEIAADDIAKRTTDPALKLDALRWKLSASKASQHAATQMAPMMALLDTWALAEQMRQFFADGAGAKVFGADHGLALNVAERLASDAERLARGVASETEVQVYQEFVDRYSREHPLGDLDFARVSVVGEWVTETNQQVSLVGSVGTVSQSMSDVSERMRMFGERAPSQAVWEVQLAIGESDLGRADFGRALAQAGQSLARLTVLAESSPEQMHAGIVDLRASLLTVADRFDASWGLMARTVQEQREALAVNVHEEREAAVVAFDAQRAALAQDAQRIADQVIASGGLQARLIARDMMLYGIVLYVVILGVPFIGGYHLGRLRGPRGDRGENRSGDAAT